MAVAASSISMACDAVVDFVRTGTDALAQSITVSVGAPAAIDNHDVNRINLFFYRFEPTAFQAGLHPGDVRRVSAFCLITAFGDDDSEHSAGENELRMLGEVMRIFHETPILDAVDVKNHVTRLKAIFRPVTDEQLSQIWSIQGDVGYRPSVVYEMALAPIVPKEPRVEARRVGAVGSEIRAEVLDKHAPVTTSAQAPLVPFSRVDIRNPAWAPAICFLLFDECQYTLFVDLTDFPGGIFRPQVWLAGDPGVDVDLEWEVWTSAGGWQPPVVAKTVRPQGEFIDPDNIPSPVPSTFLVTLDLPAIPAVGEAVQLMLFARREVRREGAPSRMVRSNPLLISVIRSS